MKKSILIIDDRTDSWDTICTRLEKIAPNQYEIIGKLLDDEDFDDYFNEKIPPPDIVFLDKKIKNDIQKGFEIGKRIYEFNPNIKIIMLTEFSSKIEFCEAHSSGILSGYLRKESLLVDRKFRKVLDRAIDDEPWFDVPSQSWLKYKMTDNLKRHKLEYVKKLNNATNNVKIDIINISDTHPGFQDYLRDEKIRTDNLLAPKEWEIFKCVAMGFSKGETLKTVNTTNGTFDVLLGKIKKKLDLPGEKNTATFLIEAIKMQVPEVINEINEIAKCRITFPK